jgi:hypothetical protein
MIAFPQLPSHPSRASSPAKAVVPLYEAEITALGESIGWPRLCEGRICTLLFGIALTLCENALLFYSLLCRDAKHAPHVDHAHTDVVVATPHKRHLQNVLRGISRCEKGPKLDIAMERLKVGLKRNHASVMAVWTTTRKRDMAGRCDFVWE